MCRRRSRRVCGGRCCGGSVMNWRWSRPTLTTRRSTDRGDWCIPEPRGPVAAGMRRAWVPLAAMSTLEPERGTGTGTLVEPTPEVSHGDGDHERFAHYVQKDK